jgi:hypothetical protein
MSARLRPGVWSAGRVGPTGTKRRRGQKMFLEISKQDLEALVLIYCSISGFGQKGRNRLYAVQNTVGHRRVISTHLCREITPRALIVPGRIIGLFSQIYRLTPVAGLVFGCSSVTVM